MRFEGWMKQSLCVAMVSILSGCAAGGPSILAEDTEGPRKDERRARSPKGATLGSLEAVSDGEVRFWQWTASGELVVVYTDGLVGRVRLSESAARSEEPEYGRFLRGFSRDGRLGWTDDGQRTTIFAVEDAKLVLPLNEVGLLDYAAATPDGATFFGADREGNLHIWTNLRQRLSTPESNLETLIERQLPDATAHVAVASPLHVAVRGELIFGDASGRLSRWHPEDPEAITRLAELGAPVRAIAEGHDFYVATATNGRLSVVDVEYGENAWSEDARAAFATAHPAWQGRFAFIEGASLRAADPSSGEEAWSVPMPGLAPCGLTMSGDGRAIVVCVGNTLALVSREDGALLHIIRRTGDAIAID